MRKLAVPALALALAPVAVGAAQPAGDPGVEWVISTQRPEDVKLPRERRVAQGRPIVSQPLAEAGGAYLRLLPAEEKAFRERHRMGNSQLKLTHWLLREPGGGLRHLGWLYCGARIKMFSGQIASCFRDIDADGKLDGAAVFNASKRGGAAIEFTSIDPAPYEAWTWKRVYLGSFPKQALPYIQLQYEHDEARDRLLFRARAFQVGLGATLPLHPVVEVDPASLPRTIEVGDSRLAILAWDGKRATVRVDRALQGLILLDPPEEGADLMFGKVKGYTLRIMDIPLPQETYVPLAK